MLLNCYYTVTVASIQNSLKVNENYAVYYSETLQGQNNLYRTTHDQVIQLFTMPVLISNMLKLVFNIGIKTKSEVLQLLLLMNMGSNIAILITYLVGPDCQ